MVYNENGLLLTIVLVFLLSNELIFCKRCDNKYVSTKGWLDVQPVDHECSKDLCQVKSLPINSSKCKNWEFGPIEPYTYTGGVTLKPYILILDGNEKLTGFNISFSNIKWQSMKIRIQRIKEDPLINYCADITVTDNVTEIYYDCYFFERDNINQRFYLDFEATNRGISYRGQYGFNIPPLDWFDENVSNEDWKPFVYVEYLTNSMKLHVMPSPERLKVTAYNILVKKDCIENSVCVKDGTQCDSSLFVKNITTTNLTEEFTFPNEGGCYYFVVIPIRDNLTQTFQRVESLEIIRDHPLNYLALVGVIIVTILVTLGIMYWLSDYCTRGILPQDINIFVIYVNRGRAHSECVAATVGQLTDFNFVVKYDGNILRGEDVNMWVLTAFEECTHIMFACGPRMNLTDNDSTNIIDPRITEMQVNLVTKSTQNKILFNVVYDYSDVEMIPPVMRGRGTQTFHAIKDIHKLKAYLTKTTWDRIKAPLQNVRITNKYTDIIEMESTLLLNLKNDLW